MKKHLEEMVKYIKLFFSMINYRKEIDKERMKEALEAIDDAHQAIVVLRESLLRMYGDSEPNN